MQITATPEQIAQLWEAARAATDDPGGEYADGAYDMIQALTGNGDVDVLIKELNDEADL